MTNLEMNLTKWAGSDIVEKRMDIPEEGPAYCQIRRASYDKSSFKYVLNLYNLATDSDMYPFFYTMKKADASGKIGPNRYSEGTLISLGRAVFGKEVGVPFPDDVIGAIVIANIKLREYNGKTYASIYTFDAVPAEIVRSFGQIVQFSSDEGVIAPGSGAKDSE